MKKIILLACLLSTSAMAETTQQVWSGIGGNALHTGYVDTTSDTSKFKVLWQKPFRDPNSRSETWFDMSVTTDALYISTCNTDKYQGLYAVNLNTGDVIWKQSFPKDINLISAPAYANGLVYYIETQDTHDNQNFGYVSAFDANTGKPIFANQLPLYVLDAAAAPIFYDGHLYTLDSPHIYDMNPLGNVLNFSLFHGNDFQPIITKDYLIRSYQGQLQVTNRLTGEFEYGIQTPLDQYSDGCYLNSIYDEKTDTAFAVFFDHHSHNEIESLYAFDIKQRSIKWSYPTIDSHQPTFVDNTVYIVENNELDAIDATNGKLLWHWTIDSQIAGDPYCQTCYAPVVTKNHVIISGRGYTFAINRNTHNKDWEMPISGELALGKHVLFIADDKFNGPVTAVSIN